MSRICYWLACSFLLVLLAPPPPPAIAGSADLSGSLSYQVTGDSVTIEIDRITNISRTATTGPLNVILRFTTDNRGIFYSPGNGHNAARESLSYLSNDGTLAPGESFDPESRVKPGQNFDTKSLTRRDQ